MIFHRLSSFELFSSRFARLHGPDAPPPKIDVFKSHEEGVPDILDRSKTTDEADKTADDAKKSGSML
jgi:hypothetical protein